MLQYTGHPFVDVGVAVMESYLQKSCEEIERTDIIRATKWLISLYARKDVKGYLTVHFPNSGWCNPTIKDDKRYEYIQKVLFSHETAELSPRRLCAFCGEHAHVLADRQHIPLLTGATVLVTAPSGIKGVPVCGHCLMAVQFYPLGTIKVNGRPLFWWTPEPNLTYALVNGMFTDVRRELAGSQDKVVNFKWPYTRLLVSAQEVLDKYDTQKSLADCIGYHITNYGSEPDFDQYNIPKELLEFWREVRFAPEDVRNMHIFIERNAWEVSKKEHGSGEKKGETTEVYNDEDYKYRRNYYYEALGQAFADRNWHQSVRHMVGKFFFHKTPENLDKNCFQLCEMFLRKVGGMEKQRLDVIKKIADSIVDVLILGNSEERWIKDLYRQEIYGQEFLRFLMRVQKRLAELGDPFTLDDILILFDIASTDDTGLKETGLIRQLMLIRMFERVAKSKREIIQNIVDENDKGGN